MVLIYYMYLLCLFYLLTLMKKKGGGGVSVSCVSFKKCCIFLDHLPHVTTLACMSPADIEKWPLCQF